MAKIKIKSLAGKEVGDFELLDEVFAGEVNEALLWEAVKHYRASLRQGTHATKNRKLVSGAGKKLWKQKGTGRARVGSIRSPLWRGGGTVHGPQPRSYDYQFPKKKLLGALRSALASKLADGKLTVVENFNVEEAKTKHYRTALDKLDAKKTALLIETSRELNEKLYLGSRNLAGVELVLSSEVHPYDLLRYEHAIFSKAALEALQETLKKSVSKRAAGAAGAKKEVA
ncbi:MAG TPA: 50S ribosomal protein L4 [Acidobacteriaceae bacterium]|nr:50S ribosomal protein L4 [Acidobacteriaceae bacterium]